MTCANVDKLEAVWQWESNEILLEQYGIWSVPGGSGRREGPATCSSADPSACPSTRIIRSAPDRPWPLAMALPTPAIALLTTSMAVLSTTMAAVPTTFRVVAAPPPMGNARVAAKAPTAPLAPPLALPAAPSLPLQPPLAVAGGRWGEAALTNFDGKDGDLVLDGEVLTGVVALGGSVSAGCSASRCLRARATATSRHRKPIGTTRSRAR